MLQQDKKKYMSSANEKLNLEIEESRNCENLLEMRIEKKYDIMKSLRENSSLACKSLKVQIIYFQDTVNEKDK